MPTPISTISSGSLHLDKVLGIGGFPRGCFIEVFGPETGGKTTLCQHIAANAQKGGGICAWIDADHTLDLTYARHCSIDLEQLYLSEPNSAEQALDMLEILAGSGSLAVIVLDSISALTPQVELAASYGEPSLTSIDYLISQTLSRLAGQIKRNNTLIVLTNQFHHRSGAIYHQLAANPARLALKMHAAMRLEMRPSGLIQGKRGFIGSQVAARVIKNNFAPCFQAVELDIMYNVGINITGEIFDLGTRLSIIEDVGSAYYFQGIRLGGGREEVMNFMTHDKHTTDKIEEVIRQSLFFSSPMS